MLVLPGPSASPAHTHTPNTWEKPHLSARSVMDHLLWATCKLQALSCIQIPKLLHVVHFGWVATLPKMPGLRDGLPLDTETLCRDAELLCCTLPPPLQNSPLSQSRAELSCLLSN